MKKDMTYALAMVAIAILGAVGIIGYAKSAHADGGEAVMIPVPVQRVAECQAQGGCALVTREEFMAAQQQAFDAGRAAGKQGCRSSL